MQRAIGTSIDASRTAAVRRPTRDGIDIVFAHSSADASVPGSSPTWALGEDLQVRPSYDGWSDVSAQKPRWKTAS